MLKRSLIILGFLSLQACGFALVDPNARSNSLPATPSPGTEDTYTVGGTLEGLPLGFALDTSINDTDIELQANGPFVFPATFFDEDDYGVNVGTLPGGYTCEVVNGSGVIEGANVNDVLITCTCTPPDAFVDTQPATWNGNGTELDPYQVWTAAQLNHVAGDENLLDASYVQVCELDYTDIDPTPIGTGSDPFGGRYDGQTFFVVNYTSDALDPSVDNQRKGLFGVARGATFENMRLDNFEVVADAAMNDGNTNTGAIGALLGEGNDVIVQNVLAQDIHIKANDITVRFAGGLIGIVRAFFPASGVTQQGTLQNITMQNVLLETNDVFFAGGLAGEIYGSGVHQNLSGDEITLASCKGCCGGLTGLYRTAGPSANSWIQEASFVNTVVVGNGEVGGLFGALNGRVIRSQVQGSAEMTALPSMTPTSNKVVGGFVGQDFGNRGDVRNTVTVVDVIADPSLDSSGVFYGATNGMTLNNNSYLDGLICDACSANAEISAQTDVDVFYDGLDDAQAQGLYPWNFGVDWELQEDALPALIQVP